MAKITKVVLIQADPEKVIDYISQVANHSAFISALKSVENVTGDSRESGSKWEWSFVMGGIELKGKAEMAAYTPGKLYSFKTNGGVDSVFRYTVEPEGTSSRLTIDVEYAVPDTVLAKLLDAAVIERLNNQEGERAAENLKAILEV